MALTLMAVEVATWVDLEGDHDDSHGMQQDEVQMQMVAYSSQMLHSQKRDQIPG